MEKIDFTNVERNIEQTHQSLKALHKSLMDLQVDNYCEYLRIITPLENAILNMACLFSRFEEQIIQPYVTQKQKNS